MKRSFGTQKPAVVLRGTTPGSFRSGSLRFESQTLIPSFDRRLCKGVFDVDVPVGELVEFPVVEVDVVVGVGVGVTVPAAVTEPRLRAASDAI